MSLKIVFKTISTVILIAAPIFYLYPSKKLSSDIKINKLVVLKSKRKLLAFSDEQLIKTYKIQLGKNPVGPKRYEGDNRTPEGKYFISGKNPNSRFYKNLGISYPNSTDIARAKKIGRPVGGDIKLHGLPTKNFLFLAVHYFYPWTRGCIALKDKEVDELYESVSIGTPIIIKP